MEQEVGGGEHIRHGSVGHGAEVEHAAAERPPSAADDQTICRRRDTCSTASRFFFGASRPDKQRQDALGWQSQACACQEPVVRAAWVERRRVDAVGDEHDRAISEARGQPVAHAGVVGDDLGAATHDRRTDCRPGELLNGVQRP